MTVVLLIGCATFVYADFDRPGPEGKQKLILLYKELQLKSMIGLFDSNTICLKDLSKYTLYIAVHIVCATDKRFWP